MVVGVSFFPADETTQKTQKEAELGVLASKIRPDRCTYPKGLKHLDRYTCRCFTACSQENAPESAWSSASCFVVAFKLTRTPLLPLYSDAHK